MLANWATASHCHQRDVSAVPIRAHKLFGLCLSMRGLFSGLGRRALQRRLDSPMQRTSRKRLDDVASLIYLSCRAGFLQRPHQGKPLFAALPGSDLPRRPSVRSFVVLCSSSIAEQPPKSLQGNYLAMSRKCTIEKPVAEQLAHQRPGTLRPSCAHSFSRNGCLHVSFVTSSPSFKA